MLIMMVGHKTDMRHLRAVSIEETKKFAEERNLFFVEASAVDSTNVDTVFVRLIEEITNTVIPKIMKGGQNNADSGVWPYLPSTNARAKTLPGQDRMSDKRHMSKRNACCKSIK